MRNTIQLFDENLLTNCRLNLVLRIIMGFTGLMHIASVILSLILALTIDVVSYIVIDITIGNGLDGIEAIGLALGSVS